MPCQPVCAKNLNTEVGGGSERFYMGVYSQCLETLAGASVPTSLKSTSLSESVIKLI